MWKARVLVMSASALIAVSSVASCGGSSRSRDGTGDGGWPSTPGGHSGDSTTSGASAGGSGAEGGSRRPDASGGATAEPSGGGTPASSGGEPSTPSAGAAGEPATGGEGGAAASDCGSKALDCFEPCGGDPFGNWVLEDGCYPGGGLASACDGDSIRATHGTPNLRMQLADFGVLSITGREAWDLVVTAPPTCLRGARCDVGVGWADPLIFSSSRTLIAGCTENACGTCDCVGTAQQAVSFAHASWSHAGEQLTLGSVTAPFCVDDDVLWLGGGLDANGQTKVAYKFRKQSCTSATVPCEERPLDACESTGECTLGRCVPTGGDATKCTGVFSATYCDAPDCTWVSDRCSPSGTPACSFAQCGVDPVCRLGPPVARCTGDAWCGGPAAEECSEPGCSIRTCSQGLNGEGLCENLYVDECDRAPGCSIQGSSCAGVLRCAAITDEETCERAGCQVRDQCWGAPVRTCSELSVEECHSLPGCTVEW